MQNKIIKKTKMLTFRITEQEEKMIKILKDKYSINISQFLRNKLFELNKKNKE